MPIPTPGSSGGPIVDEESGAVVGLIRGSKLDNRHEGLRGWAIPAEAIYEVFILSYKGITTLAANSRTCPSSSHYRGFSLFLKLQSDLDTCVYKEFSHVLALIVHPPLSSPISLISGAYFCVLTDLPKCIFHPDPVDENRNNLLQFNRLPSSKKLNIRMFFIPRMESVRITRSPRWIEDGRKDKANLGLINHSKILSSDVGLSKVISGISGIPVSSFPGPMIRSKTSLRLTLTPNAWSSFVVSSIAESSLNICIQVLTGWLSTFPLIWNVWTHIPAVVRISSAFPSPSGIWISRSLSNSSAVWYEQFHRWKTGNCPMLDLRTISISKKLRSGGGGQWINACAYTHESVFR